jgi:hypothetical protein
MVFFVLRELVLNLTVGLLQSIAYQSFERDSASIYFQIEQSPKIVR